jgi:predicted small secreted protein
MNLITKLCLVGVTGLLIAACTNTFEGMGKDLQTMGNSMGGNKSSSTPNQQTQTQGKDVEVTPVK